MEKSLLKSIILQEAMYVKNLLEEKKQIEEELSKLNDEIPEEEVDETTGKGLGLQHRASHHGEIGDNLKVEETKEVDEMLGLSHTASHQAGKKTTNPVYKKRKENGYINEEQIVRNYIRNNWLKILTIKM